jgi:hypothetical protein
MDDELTKPLPRPGRTAVPAYGDGSIVNLMGSIVSAYGGQPTYDPLGAIAPRELGSHRNLVLLVIDGLGYEFLARRPDSFLHRHLHSRITSVFPTTTATAITAYLTGVAPQQHGLTGWFTYLKELGSVAAVLPFRPRHGGAPYSKTGVHPHQIFDCPPIFDQLDAKTYVVSAEHIIHSDYSHATSGRAERRSYSSLEGLFERTEEILSSGHERQYVYAYWPELDSLCHQWGSRSEQADRHFREIDSAVAAFMERIQGTDTTAIVCADHGLIDTMPDRTIDLSQHPRLAETLVLPLCGEPRVAYCYIHPEKCIQFEDYVTNELGHCCSVFRSTQLLEQGYFGLGTPHVQLTERIGHYTLIMGDNYVIKDHVLGEKPFEQIGVHGGLSTDELYVPLIVLKA